MRSCSSDNWRLQQKSSTKNRCGKYNNTAETGTLYYLNDSSPSTRVSRRFWVASARTFRYKYATLASHDSDSRSLEPSYRGAHSPKETPAPKSLREPREIPEYNGREERTRPDQNTSNAGCILALSILLGCSSGCQQCQCFLCLQVWTCFKKNCPLFVSTFFLFSSLYCMQSNRGKVQDLRRPRMPQLSTVSQSREKRSEIGRESRINTKLEEKIRIETARFGRDHDCRARTRCALAYGALHLRGIC